MLRACLLGIRYTLITDELQRHTKGLSKSNPMLSRQVNYTAYTGVPLYQQNKEPVEPVGKESQGSCGFWQYSLSYVVPPMGSFKSYGTLYPFDVCGLKSIVLRMQETVSYNQ